MVHIDWVNLSAKKQGGGPEGSEEAAEPTELYHLHLKVVSPPWRLLWCWMYATRDAEATPIVTVSLKSTVPIQYNRADNTSIVVLSIFEERNGEQILVDQRHGFDGELIPIVSKQTDGLLL